MKKRCIIRLLIIVAVIGVVLILNASLLFPWQWEARKNKRAAFEYINATYSDARYIRAYYRTTKINLGNPGHDQFIFERNGIRFPVFAEHGRVANDFYWNAFAEHQLYITYIKPFTEPRNITAEFSYHSSDLREFFDNNPDADISQFDGSVDFGIYDNRCTDPRSLGWLYDFYCYCKEEFPFSSYTVTIICMGSSTIFSNESEFKNEADFYNSFR